MKKIMKALLSLLMIVPISGCSGEKTVGKDIKIDEITEFYYTYSSSTNPPDYQRYRFYVDDGKYMFYHEARKGDHWPLTEDDITVSGKVELTEEQWKEFFKLLENGKVKKREEHLESGDPGPWLYLYWKKDGGKVQEFSFETGGRVLEFVEFCRKLAAQ